MMEFDGMLLSCASLIFVASNIFRLWGGLFCWAAATVQWGSGSDRGGTWVGEFEELQSRNELDVLGKCFDGFCCSQGGHLVLLGLSSQTKQFLEEWLWCKMLQVTFRALSGSTLTRYRDSILHWMIDHPEARNLWGQQCTDYRGHSGHDA